MRISNYANFVRLPYRNPVLAGDWAYITGETLTQLDVSWGFSIEQGFLPSTDPATMSFTVSFPKSKVTSTEWNTILTNLDIGNEVWFQTLYTESVVSADDYGVQYFIDSGAPRFLVKSIERIPDIYGNIQIRVECEDILSRAMNVPITMSGGTLASAVPAWTRLKAIMSHIGDYYDGIFPELYSGWFNGQDLTNWYEKSLYVPAVTGSAYAAEQANGIITDLLKNDLAFLSFYNGGYSYQNPVFFTPRDPGVFPTPSTFLTKLNAPFDFTQPSADYYVPLVSEITLANNADEVIPCLRIELASDATKHYSWQDNDAILKYGAKYVKQPIGCVELSFDGATNKNSVDVYGKSIESITDYERITNYRFPMVSHNLGLPKPAYYMAQPAAMASIYYQDDYITIDDWFIQTKVSHSLTPTSWECSVDLWKPNLTNGWII